MGIAILLQMVSEIAGHPVCVLVGDEGVLRYVVRTTVG